MPHTSYQVLGYLSLQIELFKCLLIHLETLFEDNHQFTKIQQKPQQTFKLAIFFASLGIPLFVIQDFECVQVISAVYYKKGWAERGTKSL